MHNKHKLEHVMMLAIFGLLFSRLFTFAVLYSEHFV